MYREIHLGLFRSTATQIPLENLSFFLDNTQIKSSHKKRRGKSRRNSPAGHLPNKKTLYKHEFEPQDPLQTVGGHAEYIR
jgi:hypothetical protein